MGKTVIADNWQLTQQTVGNNNIYQVIFFKETSCHWY